MDSYINKELGETIVSSIYNRKIQIKFDGAKIRGVVDGVAYNDGRIELHLLGLDQTIYLDMNSYLKILK